jgi:ABC-type proline/glycine betaine transport system permease subunit
MQGQHLIISTDRAAGILFLAIGGAGLWFGRDLPFGNLSHIGSGFLPRLTFAGVVIMGCVKLLLSFIRDGERTSLVLPRSLLLITLAFVAFGAFIERLGLVVAVAAMLSAVEFAGGHKKSLKSFVLLLVGLIVFSVVVFRYVLGIPLEVWPKWT